MVKEETLTIIASNDVMKIGPNQYIQSYLELNYLVITYIFYLYHYLKHNCGKGTSLELSGPDSNLSHSSTQGLASS